MQRADVYAFINYLKNTVSLNSLGCQVKKSAGGGWGWRLDCFPSSSLSVLRTSEKSVCAVLKGKTQVAVGRSAGASPGTW